MKEENIRTITELFSPEMQKKSAIDVYNVMAGRLSVTDTTEAKELIQFIRQLQGLDAWMLQKGKELTYER